MSAIETGAMPYQRELDDRLERMRSVQNQIAWCVEELRNVIADPNRLGVVASRLVELAVRQHDLPTAAVGMVHRAIAFLSRGENTRAVRDLEDAWNIRLEHPGHVRTRSLAALLLGHAYFNDGKNDLSRRWFNEAITAATSPSEMDVRAAAIAGIGRIQTMAGRYEEALAAYWDAIAVVEKSGNTLLASDLYLAIGNIYARMEDSANALVYLRQSIDICRSLGYHAGEVKGLSEVGDLDLASGKAENVLDELLMVASASRVIGERPSAVRAMIGIGEIMRRRGDYGSALEVLHQAYKTLGPYAVDDLRVDVLRKIGEIQEASGSFDEARFIFDQALGMAEDIGDPRLQYQLHQALSDVYEQLGYHAQSLEHHKRYAELKDEISGEEKQKAIAELQIKFDVEKAEREREIYRLKAEQLENDMLHKQNELTVMALNLAQKNELLESLKSQIKRLQKKHKDDGEEIVEHIIKDIDASKSADDDWKLFEQQLEAVHPDFIRTLSERYPALTPTELKICSLIKTNLSAKDIANFLYISVRTAEVHRLNIRKKLKLGRGIGLATFLASM